MCADNATDTLRCFSSASPSPVWSEPRPVPAGVIRQHNQQAVCIHLPYFIDPSSFINIQGYIINTRAPLAQGKANSSACHRDFSRGHKWACHGGHRANSAPIPLVPILVSASSCRQPQPSYSNKERLPLRPALTKCTIIRRTMMLFTGPCVAIKTVDLVTAASA